MRKLSQQPVPPQAKSVKIVKHLVYKCHICETSSADPVPFENDNDLRMHLTHNHRDRNGGFSHFVCPLCFFYSAPMGCKNMTKTLVKIIANHNKAHGLNTIARKCPIPDCGSFKTWEEYRHHICNKHTEYNDGMRFICYNSLDGCDFISDTPWHWLKHVVNEVSVWCQTCRRKFCSTHYLNRHLNNNHMDYNVPKRVSMG